jgi:uncharacterized membrane protein
VVSSIRTATQLMIIARPDQSATWRANLLLLLALAVPVLAIAVVFAALGAWLVLPFAGLELLALGSALYHVNWKQQYRHVITVSAESVSIAKGHYAPRQRWRFARHSAGLTVTAEQHPWDGPELCVYDHHESVTLGEFLNRDDSLKLIALLQQEVRVRSRGVRTQREF